jgi:hypothetical protein
MHPLEDGHLTVCVVIHKDAALAFVGPHRAPHILHKFPLERNREGEEEGVNLRTIEALAKVQISNYAKALCLGLILLNVVGEEALTAAIDQLGDDVALAPPAVPLVSPPAPPSGAATP